MSVMTKLLVLAVAALLGSLGCGGGDNTVDVTFRDGKIIAPATVGAGHLVFRVHNEDAIEQRFAVVELLTADATNSPVKPWDPAALPVENGLVRDYTYTDEPGLAIRTAGGGYNQSYARGVSERRPRPETIGVVVAAGATKDVEISYMKTDAGSTFVLFSDLPGRYESGQWTAVTVE